MAAGEQPDVVAARGRIEWTRRHMPVLRRFGAELAAARPFDGMKMSFRLHIEPKTAVLLEVLRAAGADLLVMGNAGTTQRGTASALVEDGFDLVLEGSDEDQIERLVAAAPSLVLDNGAELTLALHDAGTPPVGGTEETTTGALLLRERGEGALDFPVVVINDSPLKSIVENKHGVGESVIDTISRVTNLSFHRRTVTVFGYGWCGRGIALYAQRRGADVRVIEPDPVAALEAAMDGFAVLEATESLPGSQVVITATGASGVLSGDLLELLEDGVILANAGHLPHEIDIETLRSAGPATLLAPSIERFALPGDRQIFLVAQGHIVNLAAEGGLGNPIEAMDLGLSLQALSLERACRGGLQPGAQAVPDEVNHRVARAMLAALG